MSPSLCAIFYGALSPHFMQYFYGAPHFLDFNFFHPYKSAAGPLRMQKIKGAPREILRAEPLELGLFVNSRGSLGLLPSNGAPRIFSTRGMRVMGSGISGYEGYHV